MMTRLYPMDTEKKVPVFAKNDKMGYVPSWRYHLWLITHAMWPMAIHQAVATYLGRNIATPAVFFLYLVAFNINGAREIRMMRELSYEHGFLDGDKHDRDYVPDNSVSKVHRALLATSTIRPILTVFLAYRSTELPSSLSWCLPIEIGMYSIVLDFYFYWYHRLMHDLDGLWRYHRTHHLTKHPIPLLTLFADFEQEVFDIIVVPLASYFTMKAMGFPMNFYDWWFCQSYVVFFELWGHSGLRIMNSVPTPFGPLLKYLGMEMNTEDHDLHHRKGWRSSYNYGKQSRVWDRLFGTCHPRLEFVPENVDYSKVVRLWWW